MNVSIGHIFDEIKITNGREKANEDLVDEFSGQFQTDWTIPEAYMCILLSAVYADGVETREELEYVRALVRRCQTFKGRDVNELSRINVSVSERMNSRPNALDEACRTLPHDMHMTLLAHCIDIVLADGELAALEKDFLQDLIERLRIGEVDVQRVMQVIFQKNRY